MAEFRHIVRAAPQGATVWGVLAVQLGVSRTLIRRLKANDGLYLNGRPAHTHQAVRAGDELCLRFQNAESEKVDPEPVPLDILYEDDDVLVLNKPSAMVVHPTHGCFHGTLANGVAQLYRDRGVSAGIHPVHRIDRNTSGLVLFAKHPYAHQQLADQLNDFKLDRLYLAIAQGWLEEDAGTISAPIARVPGPGGYRIVSAEGQEAITHFQVLARAAERRETLLSLRLETGRTHQIRVHLSHHGHPLLADVHYGQEHPVLARVALHARTLGFRHPRHRTVMTMHAPMPNDLAAYLEQTFALFEEGLP